MKPRFATKILIILLTAALSLPQVSAYAGSRYIAARKSTVEDGLPSNSVYSIVQDSIGFIWIGTNNGLSRFDGKEFRNYKHSSRDKGSLSSNSILRLMIDRSGRIWITLDNGVDIYDPVSDTFCRFGKTTEDGTGINDRAIDVMEDSDGEIWVTTVNSGVFRYSPAEDRLRVYRHDPSDDTSISQDYVSCVYQSRDGTIWLGTYSEGLCSFSKETGLFTTYRQQSGRNSISDNSINAILEDSFGNLWLGTVSNGLDRFDRATGRFTNFNDTGNGDRLYHMHLLAEKSPGQLIVCTDNGASVFRVTEKGIYFDEGINGDFSETAGKFVYSYLRDREGNMWFGSLFDGLEFHFAHNNFAYYGTASETNPSLGKIASAICEYKDGLYWIGTKDNGILLFDNRTKEVRPYRTAADVGANFYNIYDLLVDKGNLWAAVYQRGIEVTDLATGRYKTYLYDPNNPQSQPSARVFALLRSSNGRIYAGAANGLYYYDRDNDDFVKMKPDSRILSLAEDMNGRLWIATAENGLYMYDPGKDSYRSYRYDPDDNSSISRNALSTVAVDRRNRVWIGTTGYGICRYDNATDSFIRYDNLPIGNDIISKIIPDDDQLWISTEKGLVMLNNENAVVKEYSKPDGLYNEQFSTGAGIKSSNGTIMFGTGDGLCIFSPHNLVENKYVPPVVITNLSIWNHTARPGEEDSPLTLPIEITDKITLSHRQTNIELQFAALSYLSPQENRYRYRMDGMDVGWIETDGRNALAIYNNLRAGDYTFRVQGSNSNLVWNPRETTLQIRILPPFLKSRAAFLMYGLIGLALLVLTIRYLLTRSDRQHRARIAQMQAEKEKEIYDSRIEFFTNVAHEIRTPLSLIIGPLEYVMKSRNISDRYGDYLSVIEQNYKRLHALVNQLLDFRKIDSGSYALRYGECDVGKLARDMIKMFEPTAHQKNIRILPDIQADSMVIITEQEALTKILSNLLTNAIKFASGEVRIRVFRQGEGVVLSVTDDGPGIPLSEREKIFEAFYQIKNSRNGSGKGVGIGLHMTKTLVSLMGGNITVTDREDGVSGAVMTIYVPGATAESVIPVVEEKRLDEYIIGSNVPSEFSDEDEEESTSARKHTIMVVDDNAEILDFLSKILASEYFVISASSGEEALNIVGKNELDLIVSDIMMDGIDGVELVRRLKSDINTSHVPVVLLTAKTDVGTKIASLEEGADAYIEKPFSPTHLKAQLRNLLRKHSEIRNEYASSPLAEIRTAVSNRMDEEFLEKCRDIIIENMNNPDLSVDLLASELAISRTSIFKKLKAITGMTPNDYMKLVRLKEACRMMVEGEYRITEIGFITGFSSSSYFAKCFVKQFGILPTDFIRNIQDSVDNDNEKING